MPFLQIGPRQPLPDPVPDRLLPALLSVDPWMHHGRTARACSVTMADGTVHPRVSVRVIDEFDDAWAAGFDRQDGLLAAGIAEIRPSSHALPAALATKAMHGEEWRMGAYRYAVQTFAGDTVTLIDSVAVWLPDSISTTEVSDVIPNPTDEYPPGDEIPEVRGCSVSTPQTYETDRQKYEQCFAGIDSPHGTIRGGAALIEAYEYARQFPLGERPFAYAAAWDRLTTGVSRYERFMGDDIDLLARFAAREGHCHVPEGHIEGGRPLDIIGLTVLASTGRLSPTDRERLESIPGWEAASIRAAGKILTPQKAAELAAARKDERQ